MPVELGPFLRSRWRRVVVVAILPVVAVLGGLVLQAEAPMRYDATVSVVVPTVGPDTVGALPAAESFRVLVNGSPVAGRVASSLGRPLGEVRGRIDATQQGRGNLVEVRYRDGDRAAALEGLRAAVSAGFEALYAVEREAARRAMDLAARRSGDPEGGRLLAESRAAADQVEARVAASISQVDRARTGRAPRAGGAPARAAAVSLLLAGVALAGWEWARPVGDDPSRRPPAPDGAERWEEGVPAPAGR